jgi:predicted PurR-regulated permease PerM
MKFNNQIGSGTAVFAAVVLGLAVTILVAVLLTWPTMLMFGVVHGFLPYVPALGLWHTFLVMILVRLVVGSRGSSTVNDNS